MSNFKKKVRSFGLHLKFSESGRSDKRKNTFVTRSDNNTGEGVKSRVIVTGHQGKVSNKTLKFSFLRKTLN